MSAEPTPAELQAYRAGHLTPLEFERIDRWLAAQPAEVQERLLGDDGNAAGSTTLVLPAGPSQTFAPDTDHTVRFRPIAPIGAGGMGIVELVHDCTLGRDLVVKRCRPRRPDEALAAYARRVQLFQREARVTAQLEHPGIVPVHDVGEGPLGEPAFAMKRLDGEPFSQLIAARRAGGELDPARLVEAVTRIADAVGYAHRRGIVHRDLKPENIIVGSLGAVHVIDWGLAGMVAESRDKTAVSIEAALSVEATRSADSQADPRLSGLGMGTPAWMAPEQAGHAGADARMDVFALGGLLMAGLTGHGPRDGLPAGSVAVDLTPLNRRGLPRGLVAVARRCLHLDPTARYADASAMADDLRRWLAAELTLAENPGPLTRAWWALKRSSKLRAAALGMAVAASVIIAVETTREHQRRDRALAAIEVVNRVTDTTDVGSVRQAQREVGHIIENGGRVPAATATLDRLVAIGETLDKVQRQARQQGELKLLAHAYPQRGPWATEVQDWRALVNQCGLSLRSDRVREDTVALTHSPLKSELLIALVHLRRADLVGAGGATTAAVPTLIEQAASTPGWTALAELLAAPVLERHELIPIADAAIKAAAAESDTCDLMLASFGPDPRFAKIASGRLKADPGAFWPRIVDARLALERNDFRTVKRDCLIALGSEPQSVWLHLLFGYVALFESDHARVLAEAVEGLAVNPDHAELVALRAAGMCGLGSVSDATAVIQDAGVAPLFRRHLEQPDGHPIERSLKELAEHELTFAEITAADGPLVRLR